MGEGGCLNKGGGGGGGVGSMLPQKNFAFQCDEFLAFKNSRFCNSHFYNFIPTSMNELVLLLLIYRVYQKK